jgi:protein tyrosine phosphatase (PTP) superfamily phosphohydrolase (DUF442 family)
MKRVSVSCRLLHPAPALALMLLLAGLTACTPPLRSAAPVEHAPNRVQASTQLLTSGQPSAEQLQSLHREAFALVVNLAPRESSATLPDEAKILAGKRIAYVAIPVDLDHPREADFELFSASLKTTWSPVWVHCQRNQRASMFAFLYRVIHLRVDPEEAYEKVTEVWVPTANWVSFANRLLSRHRVGFRL